MSVVVYLRLNFQTSSNLQNEQEDRGGVKGVGGEATVSLTKISIEPVIGLRPI